MATETKLRQLAEQGCAVYYFYSSERYLVRRAVAAASQLLAQGRTKRPPCWTERPRALSSSSWRRVPSRFLAPGAWSSCRRSTQALTATKTWTSSARRWAVWKTPWWCWAPCLTWNAISSSWASGRKSSSTSAKSWALPRSWPNPSPMS